MTPGYLAWLLTNGKAEIIDRATYTLLLTWMRPKDIKRRATA
jgi:hypothetical protein